MHAATSSQSIGALTRDDAPCTNGKTPIRPIRVMQFVWGLCMGGMEKTLINVCNNLPSDRFRVTMCVTIKGCAMESRLDREHVELLHMPKRFGNDPTVVFRLAREMKKRKIDILHTNMWATLVEGWAAARIARVPIRLHEEHGSIQTTPHRVLAQKLTWKSMDRVAAVSGALADRMHNTIGYPRDRIAVIDNSVDTDRFQPLHSGVGELRRRFGLPENAIVIGMVSRFVPFKNHAGVLRAIAALRDEGIVAHLGLVGDGPLLGELQQLASDLNISDRTHFLGETDHVERALNCFDLVVSNSACHEGLSLALLEAMACERPVIATDVAAHSEVLDQGRAGLLIEPRNHDALVDALKTLLASGQERARLGQRRATAMPAALRRYVDGPEVHPFVRRSCGGFRHCRRGRTRSRHHTASRSRAARSVGTLRPLCSAKTRRNYCTRQGCIGRCGGAGAACLIARSLSVSGQTCESTRNSSSRVTWFSTSALTTVRSRACF